MMRFVLASCPVLGRLALGLAVLVVPCVTVVAAPPTTAEEKAKIVGQPVSLQVEPASIVLTGPRGMQQLVVTGRYADGRVRDLTPFVAIQPESAAVLNVSAEQMVIPLQNGT
ncbi:MAG TPA: hypothetical protein VNX28_18715, partial [Gemmataceae bacterium]|nr:hypothetical protein [Gemmataceae bacterium]